MPHSNTVMSLEIFSSFGTHLLIKDTLGIHAGIFEIGEFTRQSLGLGTGCAESTAAGTYGQAIVTDFLVGAVTMMVSNVLFSQGPWMPWQMFSMGIIGFLAGVLFRKGLLRRSRGSLATFGAFAAVIIYGGIMNPVAALMYNSQTINWEMLKAYYVSGLPMDLIHAAEVMLEKLDRIKVKYGLVE